MSILCLVPARGGSKGIPRKNLAEIAPGETLLSRTLDQALRCFPADDVVVSTEDAEIAAAARATDAVCLMRPAELAEDNSTTASVVDHVLAELDPRASRFDAIAILQVTSPLREDGDVTAANAMILSGDYDSVVAAYPVSDGHPAKMYIVEDGTTRSVMPEFETARRQDLPVVYRRNGSIFMATRAYYTDTGRLWGGRVGLVEMPPERSIDVDRPEQLETVRQMLAG